MPQAVLSGGVLRSRVPGTVFSLQGSLSAKGMMTG